MSDLLNLFLVLVMVVSVWPSLLHVARHVAIMSPRPSSKLFRNVRLGLVSTTRKRPHPADPPVCMAKLIMLRHRMQQANARRSQQRITPVQKPNIFGHSRHRPAAPSWVGQATYNPHVSGRGWSINSR